MWRNTHANDDYDFDEEETRTCFQCHQRGHIARDCNESFTPKQCFRCNGFGHIARHCTTNLSDGQRNDVRHSQNNRRFSTAVQGKLFHPRFNIQIRKGCLTNQDVDVIVVCSSSDGLLESVLQAAGHNVRMIYEKRNASAAEFDTFAIKSSSLPCKKIFFQEWTPSDHLALTEQTIKDFIAEAIAYVLSQNYRSVAFPAIGCGKFGLNANFIAQTMINHVKIEQYPLNIEFIIHPQLHQVFSAFKNAIESTTPILTLPDASTYADNNDNSSFTVRQNTREYNTVVDEFNNTMSGHYNRINCIERIQNERWQRQYVAHRDDFQKRLNMNTEKFLYHGCSDVAADSIINEYFNRSYAGKNGTKYGRGVYFSSNAQYSHSYAVQNYRGERCMFFARVLIGRSTLGNTGMKVCPPGYDTTTNGQHIYVTYHDTQAYGQYLIRYQ